MTGGSPSGRGPAVIEALATAVVEADAATPSTWEPIIEILEAAQVDPATPEELRAALAQELAALQDARSRGTPAVQEALQRLGALVERVQRHAGAPAPAAAARVVRDQETIELFGDFLEEATEGISRADEILLAIEHTKNDAEKTNNLFRIFHTIKGVAGFLELTDVISLAQITETLLDHVRDGEFPLEGDRLEAVFSATVTMGQLLTQVRAAVEGSTEFPPEPSVPPLVKHIQEVVDAAVAAAGAHQAAPPAVAAPQAVAAQPALAAPPPRPAPPSPATPAVANAAVQKTSAPPAAPPVQAAPPPVHPPAAVAPPVAAPPAPAPREEPAPPARAVIPMGGQSGVEAPPEAGAAPPPGAGGPPQIRETLKVDLERVDSVVEMIGELIIVESMVVHAPEIQSLTSLRLRNYLNQLTKISRDLQNVAMRMRMVPVRGVFQKMARMVRELSRKTGKDVRLEPVGEGTEMDRSMVERIEDPLVHLIRNAVDHGVETPEERVASGKPPEAVLRLAAYHEGGSIVVELADDGRGLQREAILRRALLQGLVRDGEALDDEELYGHIFHPGFSTARQVTELSGRGVGMDVVKRNVESMRGRVTVSSQPGKGTTFKLVLPLTLAIIDGMLIACGDERYIIPSLSIVESLQAMPGMLSTIAARGELINVRGEILPLVHLRRVFDVPGQERPTVECRVVVVESLGRKLGLVVDDVVTQQQVVIKPLGGALGDTEYLSGAAILSDGRVGLILNIDRLSRLAERTRGAKRIRSSTHEVRPQS